MTTKAENDRPSTAKSGEDQPEKTDTAVPSDPLGQAIDQLYRAINRDRIGTGGMAELRRCLRQGSRSFLFWQLLHDHVSRLGLPTTGRAEEDWMLIIGGIATMAPYSHGKIPFGRALAGTDETNASFPISRVRILLSLDPGTSRFRDAIAGAIQWLAKEHQPTDWRELAAFILTHPESLEKKRRDVVRDYVKRRDALDAAKN